MNINTLEKKKKVKGDAMWTKLRNEDKMLP
jgi:hypothetical protein